MSTADSQSLTLPSGGEEGLAYSVVVPVFNSERILPELHRRLVAVMDKLGDPFEIIFVEDCGTDQSWSVLRKLARADPRVIAVELLHNSGQGTATLCGIAHARGELVLTMDDDLQHPPEEIPKLIDAMRASEDTDVVIAVPQKKRHGWVRKAGSRCINIANSVLLRKARDLRLSGFRIMRRPVCAALSGNRYPYPALGPLLISVTRRIRNITVRHDSRKEGRSGYTPMRLLRQTMSNMIGYSMLPLRVLGVLGAAGVIGSIVIGLYYAARHFFIGISTPGWTSLMLVLVGVSGFTFFGFSVLGEYVFRIFYMAGTSTPFYVRSEVGRRFAVRHEPNDAVDPVPEVQ